MESVRVKQNKEALYQAATLLKDLNEQVVYVGGRIVGLLISGSLYGRIANFDILKILIEKH
ncbi:MAG: hypothetical protein H0U75_07315 [Legionella sp.]|nr:hypothetical protein [Legionella sp.]